MDTQPPTSAFYAHEQDPTNIDYFYDVYEALAAKPESLKPAVAHDQIKDYMGPRFYDDVKYSTHELQCKCGAKLSFPGKKLEHSVPSAAQIFVFEAERAKSITMQLTQMGTTKYDQALVDYTLTQPDAGGEPMLTVQIAQKNHQSTKTIASMPLNNDQKSMFLEYAVAMIEYNSLNDTSKA